LSRPGLAIVLLAVSFGTSSVVSTTPASGQIESDASIEAEGCVELECDEDEKSDEGFNTFVKRASAFFKTAHGKISAHSSQNTLVFAPAGNLDRIVSSASGDALYHQEPPDRRSSAFGGGRLDIGFTVDSLVEFSVLGSMKVTADPRAECSQVQVLLDPGPDANIFEFLTASPGRCGGPASRSINRSGTLAPGFYSFETNVRADGTSQTRSDGFAAARYKVRLLLGEFACTIQVTHRGQTTQGTPGDDVICGSSGRDIIFGRGGDDTVYGEGGSDEIDGGTGDDELLGGDGADCLRGGAGRDDLKGEAGEDTLLAKDGTKDLANGGAGPDAGRFDPRDDVRSVSNRNHRGGC
jgi:hypothetical protein